MNCTTRNCSTRKRVLIFLLLFPGLLLLAAGTRADTPSPVAPGAALQRLAGGFSFTEGPACDMSGNVFFTDQPNDKIWEWSAAGKLSLFLTPTGRANGLCFDRAGGLWACADERNQLRRIAPDGKAAVVVRDAGGKRLNGPNDVWLGPGGGLYFTDPFYKRPYWTHGTSEQPGQYVFYLSPDHRTLIPVATDLAVPNGLIGTPDGKTLYVSDLGAGKTYTYAVGKDGTLTGKRLFCPLGSDGMTIDSAGNVYLTGEGVTVFSRDGQQIAQIAVPEDWTANVCFGGRDRRTLFVTASHGLYALQMRTRGVGSQ